MPAIKTTPRFGAYRVLREVDQDSLGTLYEAEHPRLHKKVAVRSIGATAARDVTHSRRFLLELRSYVALEHPAIPRLYELTYQGDCPYLVTEIIPGKTLDDALNEGDQHVLMVVDGPGVGDHALALHEACGAAAELTGAPQRLQSRGPTARGPGPPPGAAPPRPAACATPDRRGRRRCRACVARSYFR